MCVVRCDPYYRSCGLLCSLSKVLRSGKFFSIVDAVVVEIPSTAAPVNKEAYKGETQVSPSPLSLVADKIMILESSGGKNNYSKCEAIGKYNRYGYGIYGGNYLCFEKDKDTEAVIKWLERETEKNPNLNQVICKYNLGSVVESCSYLHDYLAI